MTAIRLGPPSKQGLYDPQFEHDACGVGFVVDIKGRKSNSVVKQGIQVLKNLDHRGACGSEVNTGDGAGILLQMPHAFLKKVAKKDARINLPEAGLYAAGNIFMPRNATQRRKIEEVFARVVQAEGQVYLGARTVPVDNSMLGETAKASEPFVRQVFIGRGPETADEAEFERKLYVIRKRAYNEIRVSTIGGAEYWYVVSLSHKTLVYKGMLTTNQLDAYFLDLQNPLMESAIAGPRPITICRNTGCTATALGPTALLSVGTSRHPITRCPSSTTICANSCSRAVRVPACVGRNTRPAP